MSALLKVVGFVTALAVAFLGALGVGAAVGPLDVAPETHAGPEHTATEEEDGHSEHAEAGPVSDGPGGLAVSEEGYILRVLGRPQPGQPFRFVVEAADGEAVTAYDEVHEKRLHLVKVRRDGTGYQHVHPTLAADGTWTARLALAPGSNRVLADFTPTGGPELVLGTDVEVAGDYRAADPLPVTRTARIGDYRVTLTGALEAGAASPVTATVTRRGEPVTDLQPYLGAYGHLVALREGDLAYLHVHPEESDAGPEVPFVAEVPSPGRYRLFLDFRHRGEVRTAAFTLRAGPAGAHGGEGHDH